MADTDMARPDQRLIEALECLARGAWQQAHAIVQENKSPEAAWLHGIVHTLEGDLENARHWYRKANRDFPDPASVRAEIATAREFLAGGVGTGRSS
jgi:Flp pilus assembly protein TadD